MVWFIFENHRINVSIIESLGIFHAFYLLLFSLTFCKWCSMTGSNRQLHPCKGCTLPVELIEQMVEPMSLELTTSCLQGRRSPN